MNERIIISQQCIDEGCSYLADQDPRLALAIDECGEIPLRRAPQGFEQLLRAIVAQQVSVAAGNSIWSKLERAGLIDPSNVLDADDSNLRAAGLSRQKASYARALAEAAIDYSALEQTTTPEVVRTLTAVRGIGVWTAEIYAMFSLGRADAFSAGDLALQESVRMLYDLPGRPKERELRAIAETWAPWRAVAARVLWAWYHIAKGREGI